MHILIRFNSLIRNLITWCWNGETGCSIVLEALIQNVFCIKLISLINSHYSQYIMNNFVNFSKWFKRGGLERNIVSQLQSHYPNLQQNIATHRYPTLPKIVVYSASTSSDSFLKNIFPFYQLVMPNPTAETDEIITKRIAEQLVLTQSQGAQGQQTHFGFILKGFPFNTRQALLLDRYINGVNLAIHLKSGEQSAQYVSSIQSLLSYYDQRGALLSLSHGRQSNLSEIQNALDEIRIKIKRSF